MPKGLVIFLKEHISYIIFQVLVVLFLLSLFWLDGFRNVDTAIYSIIMSVLLISSFLVVRYMLRRRYLNKIAELPKAMDDALQKDAKTEEYFKTEAYLQELYRLYQHEVQSLYAIQTRQYKFMNQWIHQMKTPIAVMDLLLQEDEVDRKSMQEEVERMKRGLEMVLMTARIENFQEDLQIEPVNLKQIITSTINENKRLFITNRIFPEVHVPEDTIVMSDSKWLQFMISQFITNAVKYTFEHNKKIKIEAVDCGSLIELNVIDEGIGIPKSDLTRITKAFFTGENGRKTGESTGMGLYIAHEICLKLGHQLHINSEVGKGTTVQVQFQK
mgnify:CR=1 FL=1